MGILSSDCGMTTSRLIVASNRLPVTIKAESNAAGDKKWSYSFSSGGLVSALSGLKKQTSFIWIGWPGFEVEEGSREELTKELFETYSCIPVFLSNEVADKHYNGFSNGTLWPLFHYLPGEINFDESDWDAYYRANMAFAATIKKVANDGDMIWVQDYHLMLLPALLREGGQLPNAKIGFFLHTPFPSSEVYRVLPVRNQLLKGVLNCDLIGFHTYDYARHFISSCARLLNLTTSPKGVNFEGRFVSVGAFPIGIDPEEFIGGLTSSVVQEKIAVLEKRFEGKKIMIGVDRLDYIKGVPQKLNAFGQFLEKYPEFREKVCLVQVAVPTRTEVEEYKNLRASVNELVGSINGKYGSFDFTPVHFLYRSISKEDLIALYRVADVCLVTSTRDGMNLVSYEYIATQNDRNGCLVLSEFAGAAQSLNGAIIVNPWNIDNLVQAYHEALTISPDIAASNHQKLFKYVMKHTASYWGNSFVHELEVLDTANTSNILTPIPLTPRLFNDMGHESKLFLICVDNNLLEESEKLQKLIDFANDASHMPNAFVYFICNNFSNQDEHEKIFTIGNTGLICDQGSLIRHPIESRLKCEALSPRHSDWISLTDAGVTNWKEQAKLVLEEVTERTPGTFIEESENSLVWNFSDTEMEYGEWLATELKSSLDKILSHIPVNVFIRDRKLEILPLRANLATSIRRIVTDMAACGVTVDCVYTVNNQVEVSEFRDLPEGCTLHSISIGKHNSEYYVDELSDLLRIIKITD